MEFWEPKREGLALDIPEVVEGEGTGTGSEPQFPERGDMLRLVVTPWGHVSLYREGQHIDTVSKIIEVEVKELKSIKLIIE